jgi:hypothetical protein
MLTKTTKSLFKGTYQYKIVLVCSIASAFRSGDMDSTLEQLKKTTIANKSPVWATYQRPPTTQEQLDYAFKLQNQIKKLKDFELRVESPYISIYTNSKVDVDRLIKLDPDKVKYISVPVDGSSLVKDTVIMPKISFEFRITLGKTTQNHSAFVEWAENTTKLKLTKSCRRDLLKDRSWGGTHFYLTGNNILLMTRMHLGGSINKIERVVKA